MDAIPQLTDVTIAEDDQEHSLYVRVRPGRTAHRRELDRRCAVEYDEQGRILGFEIRHARFTGTLMAMAVTNPAAGTDAEVRTFGRPF